MRLIFLVCVLLTSGSDARKVHAANEQSKSHKGHQGLQWPCDTSLPQKHNCERVLRSFATMLLSTAALAERGYRNTKSKPNWDGSLPSSRFTLVAKKFGRPPLHHSRVIMAEPNLEDRVEKIRANIVEGDFGSRGEIYFAAQVVLIILLAFASYFPSPISAVTLPMGVVGFVLGLLLAYSGAFALGDSLTPWPKPCKENSLATDGPFAISRHPIYTGLISASAGLSLLTSSFERCVVTLALFALLNVKADTEEQMLRELHGPKYDAYAKQVPRLVPTQEGVQLGLNMLKDKLG